MGLWEACPPCLTSQGDRWLWDLQRNPQPPRKTKWRPVDAELRSLSQKHPHLSPLIAGTISLEITSPLEMTCFQMTCSEGEDETMPRSCAAPGSSACTAPVGIHHSKPCPSPCTLSPGFRAAAGLSSSLLPLYGLSVPTSLQQKEEF